MFIKKDKTSSIGSANKFRQVFIWKILVLVMLLIMQIMLLMLVYIKLSQYIFYWRTFALLLTMFVILYIVNKQENPAYKLAWVVLIMISPLTGGILYIYLAGNRTRLKFIKDALKNHLDTFKYMPDDKINQKEIKEISKSASAQATYLSKTAGYSVYKNTNIKYFSSGEENFEQLLEELNKAQSFIFMEYFIIKHGIMWDKILEILKKKAAEGVDVRLIYDDLGCAMWLPSKFIKEMSEYNIKVAPFNPAKLLVNPRHNNRDHRKITVIDGYIGFTGGINIADEYININSKYGHWKDAGVMLKGEAVWNLTLMFLQTWKMITNQEEDYSIYHPEKYIKIPIYSNEYILPYGDTPVDTEIVGENVYLNIINKAKYYVYIMTPYLIIDNEMITALTLAAKNGIDVKIITPNIPDKKMIHMVTQSYYYELINAGVEIYQYTPGFIHSKVVIADDTIATVGTINFDYRSFYLHFECGVWIFNSNIIYKIKEDFKKTLKLSNKITLEKIKNISKIKFLTQSILKLIAPLL